MEDDRRVDELDARFLPRVAQPAPRLEQQKMLSLPA